MIEAREDGEPTVLLVLLGLPYRQRNLNCEPHLRNFENNFVTLLALLKRKILFCIYHYFT